MIKTYMVKIQSRNLIHYHRQLAMIPKNKDPGQDHPIKSDPDSGSNILSLNRDRDRLQKYWAIKDACKMIQDGRGYVVSAEKIKDL